MSIIVQCPRCGTGIKLPNDTSTATCPKCVRSFKHADGREEDDDRSSAEPSGRADQSQLPAWISPWGTSAFFLASLGIVSAMLIGNRFLSTSLVLAGLAVVVLGIGATAAKQMPCDKAWFWVAGVANVGTLCLICFAGGLLNRLWEMDAPVPRADPHLMAAVPTNQEVRDGRTLTPEDRTDAATEAILQDDVFFRIMAVRVAKLDDVEEGSQPFLLIQFRIAGRGNEQPIRFQGFGKDKHQPKLSDSMGRSYAFLEMRKRKLPAGGIVFLPMAPETAEIISKRFFDYQLVFELPPGDFTPLHLDLPASAWGRQGVCKFRIAELFEPIVPAPKEN